MVMNVLTLHRLSEPAWILFGLVWCLAAGSGILAVAGRCRCMLLRRVVPSAPLPTSYLSNSKHISSEVLDGYDDPLDEEEVIVAARLERRFVGGALAGILLASATTLA
jgi:hypothetical protein